MTCTVINCHHPHRQTHPQADFIDPKRGIVLSTVYLTNEQAARSLGAKLTGSEKWEVIWSLAPAKRGLWRAVRISLLDKNCPDWREQSADNAKINRR